jgi:hypothetical protein
VKKWVINWNLEKKLRENICLISERYKHTKRKQENVQQKVNLLKE